ncbi:unnamed protein product [Sphenostylis stenocarpa]|uniref:DUF7651 domain-containing protein n=1 Tax=Sphenostylis stenocarpa TaxID=92480 RepID=A0AA86VZP2_9FABA|nr:unnamed protein product [Sphenostylis stenocarpa]
MENLFDTENLSLQFTRVFQLIAGLWNSATLLGDVLWEIIQMTVYLPRAITGKNNVFPMYICLARRVSDGTSMDNAVYKIGRLFIFRNSPGVGLNSEIKAKFILPEVNRLAREAKSGTLDLWFVSTATAVMSTLFYLTSVDVLKDLLHACLQFHGEFVRTSVPTLICGLQG